jgi:hypothetical protein
MDGDGDLDLLLGMRNGYIFYLRNTGTVLSPVFEQQFASEALLDGVDMSYNSTPVVADLDADGDFDVIIGSDSGFTAYFKNQGNAAAPFLLLSPDDLLPALNATQFCTPSFIDMDGDGDLDAVAGVEEGTLQLFLNTGTATMPVFETEPNPASPLFRVDVGGFSAPAFADLDGDGDLDAIVGEQDGNITYYERTGDCEPLALACKESVTLPLNEFGALSVNPEALDDGSPINTALSVSPSLLTCADLGAPTPVTLTVTNLFGQYGSCQVNVTVQDTSGPTISLVGEAQVTLQCGDTYTEQGATVFDGCDAFVDVVVGGETVNTDNADTYIVTYSAMDGAGNASQAVRTVIVQGSCTSEGEGEDGVQSTDQDGNHVISLSELLRVIQFYNSGGYRCATNPGDTEDGFAPGPGANQACTPHDTDYNPQNWAISLSELLRVIQFYNALGYRYCPLDNTEDDFCPGLA